MSNDFQKPEDERGLHEEFDGSCPPHTEVFRLERMLECLLI